MSWSSFFECWVPSQLFHSSFTFIKRLFSFSSLSAVRVVSLAYLRFWYFQKILSENYQILSENIWYFPAVLILACALSSPAFHMMYSACKLNKQGDNIQSWSTPFVPCLVLTASWPAYRFLRRQVRWSSIPISLRIFHSLLWSTQSKALA